MVNTLQVPKWEKTQVYNLQDETFMDLDEQPIYVVQPLEVIVTEPSQITVTFNEEQISVHLKCI